MFNQFYTAVCKSAMAASLLWLPVPALAQLPDHTIRASYVTQPTGPNSEFVVNLTLHPSDVDIVEFHIAVGYDNMAGTLLSVTDNTNQPQAGVRYEVGAEEALSGIGYANKFCAVIMYTEDDDLLHPVNLAQLNFRTTATYNHPQNQFFVYVTGRDRFAGAGDGNGGLVANLNGQFDYIPTAYDSLEPLASVLDWSVY